MFRLLRMKPSKKKNRYILKSEFLHFQKADLIAAPMTITLEREKAVRFVTPFLTHGLTLLVNKEDVFPTLKKDNPPMLDFFLLPFEVSLWIMIIVSGFMVSERMH